MLFSVVIPTYNRESVIKRAVDSVLNQTIQDFEIIVVDDGSKDKTDEVMSAYTDPRVKYIKQKNGGACAAPVRTAGRPGPGICRRAVASALPAAEPAGGVQEAAVKMQGQ